MMSRGVSFSAFKCALPFYLFRRLISQKQGLFILLRNIFMNPHVNRSYFLTLMIVYNNYSFHKIRRIKCILTLSGTLVFY